MRKRLSYKELVAKNKEQLMKDREAMENIYKKIDEKKSDKAKLA